MSDAPHKFLRGALAVSILLLAGSCFAQDACGPTSASPTSRDSFDSNRITISSAAVAVPARPSFRPFSQMGVAAEIGLGGPEFEVATPLSRKFDLRAGVNTFTHISTFQEQGANIEANIQLLSSHASLDWFPFGGNFRLSPQVYFANNNRATATATVPPGSTISLNGQDYISSPVDPLSGYGRIDFRKVAPGFSIGFGSIVPRKINGLSFPIEIGFYYVGQPALQVSFTGSACNPGIPPSIGCQSVSQDPGFQKSLTAFVARNNRNLRYARLFPIFSVGFAFRLW